MSKKHSAYIHNEMVRLAADSLKTIGIGFMAVGVIDPAINGKVLATDARFWALLGIICLVISFCVIRFQVPTEGE